MNKYQDDRADEQSVVPAERSRMPGNLLRVGAGVFGMALASVFVLQGSQAAFTATAENTGNSLAAGTVVLTDDDSNTKLFNINGLNGGQSLERCINVTYTGSLTADVRLYGAVGGTGLADGLTTDIKVGTGAAGGTGFSCTGFTTASTLFTGTLSAFGTDRKDYGTGLAGFANATNPTTRSYKITVTVSNDDTYQGKNATVDLTWEAQGRNA